MRSRGFTIVELVIVIAVMAALLALGVVNMRSSQANGRDTERKVDIETIAQHLETYYTSGTDDCTGGSITYDGLYTVRTFTTVGSSSLTCPVNISAQVLIVGGGGGGGGGLGGGGGGGGVVSIPTVSINSGNTYPIVVGDGGLGSTYPATSSSGQNSTALGATAAGGGSSNSYSGGAGVAGGSGGGAGATDSTLGLGGAASGSSLGGNIGNIYGNRGGNMTTARIGGPTRAAGGGGGGAQGLDTNCTITGDTGQYGAGSGGIGIQNAILGTNYYWGGGGGGGNYVSGTGGYGGLGGGGGGGAQDGVHGPGGGQALNSGSIGGNPGGGGGANTGGGGGGGYWQSTTGGKGGSGIVVVRYLLSNGIGTYPSTLFLGTLTSIKLALRDIDTKSISAPGITDSTQTFISATDGTILTNASPHPTKDEYVYQPLHSDGSLCNDTAECRKFNLYYRQEVDNNVIMVTSLNQ